MPQPIRLNLGTMKIGPIILGLCLCLPAVGADKDKPLPKDFKSLKALAEKGDAGAQFNLGLMYAYGTGVLEDDKEAARWFRRAAEQGWAIAQSRLGMMYSDGEGVLEDDVTAYAWLNIAAANGSASGRVYKPILAKRMTPAQIAKAQELSKVLLARIQAQGNAAKPDRGPTQPIDRSIKSTGTGFFITDDGYILTNHHVIDGANSVSVKTAKGVLRATVVKVDKLNDLAVLKVEGKFKALPIVSSRKVGLGDEVFTVGFPQVRVQGFLPKLTSGRINSLAGIKDDPRNFQISVPIQPGNSGGPLVNEYGNVVGVVVARLNALKLLKETGSLPQNVNYAVKSSFANSFLESLPKVVVKLKEPHPRTKRKFSDAVKEVQAATVLIVVR